MNTQADATREAPIASAVAAKEVSTLQQFAWSVRRELWENRSIYLAPLAAAVLIVIAFVIALAGPHRESGLKPDRQPYDFAAGLLMLTAIIVSVFYCLDALYGERRDRSVLFWKSMPVSDIVAVLAKASIPILILPVITFAATAAAQLAMATIGSAYMAIRGVNPAALWAHLSLGQSWVLLLYHLVAVHGIWWAPFYGWMLLVSAWSRRAPLLWAVLPPAGIAAVETIVFRKSHFAALIVQRLGGENSVAIAKGNMMPTDPMVTHVTLDRYLLNPGLWTGFAVTAVFLLLAIRLRRERGPV